MSEAESKNQPELQIQIAKRPTAFASGAKRDHLVESAEKSFDALGSALGAAGDRFWQALSRSGLPVPQELELSLDLGIEAGGNWIVLSGKAEANVGVTLRWVTTSQKVRSS